MIEFTGAISIIITLFCLVSAILYIFLPFWVKRIMDAQIKMNAILIEQNELIKQQIELGVDNLEQSKQ